MAEIKVMDDGPLAVTGITLLDGEGRAMETKDQVYLCRCGLSKNKPFCDGSHKGKFESKVRA
jgi:CDGSH iron-sulfur domain-containing protein 3